MSSSELKIYAWVSDALRGYYRGELYVVAEDIEQARARVRTRFETECRPSVQDRHVLEEDLMREPDICDLDQAILIRGSD